MIEFVIRCRKPFSFFHQFSFPSKQFFFHRFNPIRKCLTLCPCYKTPNCLKLLNNYFYSKNQLVEYLYLVLSHQTYHFLDYKTKTVKYLQDCVLFDLFDVFDNFHFFIFMEGKKPTLSQQKCTSFGPHSFFGTIFRYYKQKCSF